MASQLFEIVGSSSHKKPKKASYEGLDKYVKLQGDFINRSYGYYINVFLTKISAEACRILPIIQVLSIKKILKQIVKKFMLSDLELVILHHISSELEWNIQDKFIRSNLPNIYKQHEDMHPSSALLNFFLNLIAYFIKNYMGKMQETNAVKDFINYQSKGQWNIIYQQWLKCCPNKIFTLSPRTINIIYSDFTRDCQIQTSTKDYNQMVDNILELSTTYTMMPGSPKKKKNRESMIEQATSNRKIIKNKIITDSNISFQNPKPLESRLDSRLSKNQFIDNMFFKPKQKQEKQTQKQFTLSSKDHKQPVSNHVNDFFSKEKQEQVVPFQHQSTIGFRADSFPSFLDYNNRSSLIEPIPYALRSNSNISKLWQ